MNANLIHLSSFLEDDLTKIGFIPNLCSGEADALETYNLPSSICICQKTVLSKFSKIHLIFILIYS